MGSNVSTIAPADVLAVFDEQPQPGAPLTAPEVADALGCARRTAHKKLTQLAEQGAVETKKVGARGRVWWRPGTRDDETTRAVDRGSEPGWMADADAPEHALRELHDATRRLMRAETHQAVFDIAVDAARRILGLRLSGLWLYAGDENVLEPVAWTERGAEEFGEPPAFPVEESLVGRAFRDGTYRVYDDVTSEEGLYDPETRVRSELILPLGEHGVLNASSLETGAFDEVDVSLGRILAANVRTALERVDRLVERRARRRELERRRDELETLNQINALVEDTIGALVDAATRAEIERVVCERLAASEFYVDAWILERGSSADGVVVRAAADGGGHDGEPLAEAGEEITGGVVPAAIETGTVQTVPRLTDDERVPGTLRDAAVARGARACLVAPLSYADTVFGALVVHAPTQDAFSDRERTAFETLGRVVGFVINATNNRRLLLGTTAVELEVAVGDDAWFAAAADRLGGRVAVDGLVPTGDGTLLEYVTVEGVEDGVEDGVAETPGVESVRVLAASDDQWFLECAVRTADAGLRAVAEYGATVHAAGAADGTGTVTARFPASASPREALAVVRDAFPSGELVAKRVVDVSDRTVTTIRETVAERLTDKQVAVLRTGFHAGYYDAPRRTTAQELAASLGIASSTLYQHQQAAHRKLLSTVFAELSAD